MHKTMLVSLLLALGVAGTARATEPSVCARLADEARRLSATAWAEPEPLARWLRWSQPSSPRHPAPLELVLASDLRWRERVFASAGEVVGVDHLDGTPVYLVDHLAGTANCQSSVLVEALPGQVARELAPPFPLDTKTLCVSRYVRLAQILDRPAMVVGGVTTRSGHDQDYRIAPWTGERWGPSCSLALHLHVAMTPLRRFCAPGAAVCDAAQPVAEQLARAYENDRTTETPMDTQRFTAGEQPDAGVRAALNPPLNEPGAVGDVNLPLPRFGAGGTRLDAMDATFSNADPRRLPVFVNGRWWLAVVGRGGVGWREGSAVLVALYALPGRPGDAVASYQFRTAGAGLREAIAQDEVP